jgi:hypothetical protein
VYVLLTECSVKAAKDDGMLVMSFIAAIISYFGYRWLTRGERGTRTDALAAIAGGES